MCETYKNIVEKDFKLEPNMTNLQQDKLNLNKLDKDIRERQRLQLSEIQTILKESDLILNNKKVSFGEILEKEDIATAVKMLIQMLKRQTV